MKDIGQGEVYWFDFGPRIGSAPADPQPCVIVQSDLFNRSRIATAIVCVITSSTALAAAPGNVALKKGDANLAKPSVVNVSQILTVDRDELGERIGKLPAATVDRICEGLALLFSRG